MSANINYRPFAVFLLPSVKWLDDLAVDKATAAQVWSVVCGRVWSVVVCGMAL